MSRKSSNNNNTTTYHDNKTSADNRSDEQIAYDMQMAYDLQEKELQIQQRLDHMNQRDSNKKQQQQQQQQQNQQPTFTFSKALQQLQQQASQTLSLNNNQQQQHIQQMEQIQSAVSSSIVSSETNGYCTGINSSDNMLYVTCEVEGEGILVEMLVDTGAAASAISKNEMIRLNLQSKLNTKFAGIATGCGTANILGVVENIKLIIGHIELLCYFLVLDTEHPLMIFGIDQLKKFNCIINLQKNSLFFGGVDGIEVQFISSYNNTTEQHQQQQRSLSNFRQQNECNIS